jgi:hypothetical protein
MAHFYKQIFTEDTLYLLFYRRMRWVVRRAGERTLALFSVLKLKEEKVRMRCDN